MGALNKLIHLMPNENQISYNKYSPYLIVFSGYTYRELGTEKNNCNYYR